MDLEASELSADLLEAGGDVLNHDVLQREEAQSGPVSEHTGVEAPRVVAAEKHGLQVWTAVCYKNE